MSTTTDYIHEGRNQAVPPLTEARGPESPIYAPPEREDSFEEIER